MSSLGLISKICKICHFCTYEERWNLISKHSVQDNNRDWVKQGTERSPRDQYPQEAAISWAEETMGRVITRFIKNIHNLERCPKLASPFLPPFNPLSFFGQIQQKFSHLGRREVQLQEVDPGVIEQNSRKTDVTEGQMGLVTAPSFLLAL